MRKESFLDRHPYRHVSRGYRNSNNQFHFFLQEKTGVLTSLDARAKYVYQRLNSIEGITCREVAGKIPLLF